MSKAPAFMFYAGDYLASSRVQLMTLEEEGAYIRLLCHCWNAGSIPKEPEQIARLIGKGASTTLATNVATMFIPKGKVLVHDRLEKYRDERQRWIEKSREGGRKSAEMRKLLKKTQNNSSESTVKGGYKGGSRVVDDCLQPNGNSSSSTSSPIRHTHGAEIPSKQEALNYAAQIGLVEWRAEDWWLDMEAKGWKNKGDEVVNWQAFLTRVKTWWEADGKPMERAAKAGGKAGRATKEMPTWKKIEVVKEEISKHKGNVESTYYRQGDKRALKEFKDLKNKLRLLQREERLDAIGRAE